MKKSTILLSSLVLSTVMAMGQSNRKASPIKYSTHIDAQMNQDMVQNAQRTPSGHIRCFTSEVEQMKRLTDPTVKSDAEMKEWISQIVKKNTNNQSTQKASRVIPIVVHVLHNGDPIGSGENISDAQVLSQITVLNEDFSATNLDFSNTPSVFTSIATNMDVEFCLAQTDPSGQPTNGINRINTGVASYTTGSIEAAKPATQWDPTKYFNIWVCNLGGGVLGYAQFPNSGAANTDGVVIGYNYFGNTGAVSPPFNKGRTATHEVGHCFGLFHIWGDDGGACGNAGDQIADTPDQADENYGCPNFATNTSCGNSGDTNGQKQVVDAVLASAPRRASLLTSTVCNAAAINADFTGTPTVINEGMSVNFTDNSSSPDNINSWVWSFPGGTPNSHTGQTPPAITYATQGMYDVTLTIGDDNGGSDVETKTDYITVNPAGTAICDSTVAGWDWNTETAFFAAYWTQDAAACNLPLEGLIIGNNCYDDNGWATKVTSPGAGKELVEVRYVFIQSTGTGGGNLKIWDADGAGGAPGTVLASAAITTGQFSANLNQFISLPITPAIDLDLTSPSFFIGNDHDVIPLDGDTLAMGLVAGTSGNTTWALETAGWNDLANWGVDYKATAVAIVCDKATGLQSHLNDLTSVIAYPNPTTGVVEVMLPKNNANVAVFNMIGEEVANSSTTSNMLKIDLSDQPNGVYFIKVTSNGEVTTKKILLSK